MSTDPRVLNTDDLRVLWRKAGPGKRPSKEFIDSIDPEGLHVLSPVLAFHNDGAEHRGLGMAKMPGTNEPTEFEIDVLVSDFTRLKSAEALLAHIKEES